MRLLRHYQLDIIFLFFALVTILWLSLFTLARNGISPERFEWAIGAPMIIFYIVYLFRIRRNIPRKDGRRITPKTLLYWIALGVVLFGSYATPLPATHFWPLDRLFIVFTLFLADSYWDFRKLTIDHIFEEKTNA
jgi:hypothetical protein